MTSMLYSSGSGRLIVPCQLLVLDMDYVTRHHSRRNARAPPAIDPQKCTSSPARIRFDGLPRHRGGAGRGADNYHHLNEPPNDLLRAVGVLYIRAWRETSGMPSRHLFPPPGSYVRTARVHTLIQCHSPTKCDYAIFSVSRPRFHPRADGGRWPCREKSSGLDVSLERRKSFASSPAGWTVVLSIPHLLDEAGTLGPYKSTSAICALPRFSRMSTNSSRENESRTYALAMHRNGPS